MRPLDDALRLGADALHGNMRQLIPLAQQPPPCILGDGEIQHRREPHAAQHAQRVLFEALLGFTYAADTARAQIPFTAERVNQNAIQAAADRVNGEVPPPQVFFNIAYKKDMLRAAVIGIPAFRPVRRHLKAVSVLQYRHRSVSKACRHTACEETHYFFRQGRSRHIHIMHRPAHQLITDTAADEIRFMSVIQ
ncbi:hypothetical protein D3C73_1030310 [compost metagenome]